jgi:hypothetical protein
LIVLSMSEVATILIEVPGYIEGREQPHIVASRTWYWAKKDFTFTMTSL